MEGECSGAAPDGLVDGVAVRYASRKVGKADAEARPIVSVNEGDVEHGVKESRAAHRAKGGPNVTEIVPPPHDANRGMVTGVYSSGAWVTTSSGSMP